jgi:Transporter associated domain/CBS domain
VRSDVAAKRARGIEHVRAHAAAGFFAVALGDGRQDRVVLLARPGDPAAFPELCPSERPEADPDGERLLRQEGVVGRGVDGLVELAIEVVVGVEVVSVDQGLRGLVQFEKIAELEGRHPIGGQPRALLGNEPLDLRRRVRRAPVIPDTVDALDALNTLREAEVPMAVVHDEYGHFEGVVTPADILDAIAGAFRADSPAGEEEAVRREDGSWLLAGSMPADEMADQLGVTLPASRDYETVAGLVLSELRHLAQTGEAVGALGWRFEVVDMDGRRIDKVLASRTPSPPIH